jgi:hypothetical protein
MVSDMSETGVWLWEAGRFCGVTRDRGCAMEHAEAHLAGPGSVLVEHAVVTSGVNGLRHLRTGSRWTARLAGDHARWTESAEERGVAS